MQKRPLYLRLSFAPLLSFSPSSLVTRTPVQPVWVLVRASLGTSVSLSLSVLICQTQENQGNAVAREGKERAKGCSRGARRHRTRRSETECMGRARVRESKRQESREGEKKGDCDQRRRANQFACLSLLLLLLSSSALALAILRSLASSSSGEREKEEKMLNTGTRRERSKRRRTLSERAREAGRTSGEKFASTSSPLISCLRALECSFPCVSSGSR